MVLKLYYSTISVEKNPYSGSCILFSKQTQHNDLQFSFDRFCHYQHLNFWPSYIILFLRLHHWNWGELHIKGTARGTSRHHTRHFPLLDKLSPVLYTTLATTTTSASTTRQLLPTTSSSSSFSSEHYVLCMYYYYFWLDF